MAIVSKRGGGRGVIWKEKRDGPPTHVMAHWLHLHYKETQNINHHKNSCHLIIIYILTVGVNIKFPYRAVYRPYRTFKKRLARPYRFILLGVTQYYCYTRSEYRAESSLKWIFLLCLYRCCSSRLFLTRPFRFSLSIVSALLVD